MAAPTADASTPGGQRPLVDGEDVRALERLSAESLDAILAGLVGRRQSPGQSGGFEFTDYRRYTPGDNANRIDWSIYARLRELYVRTAPQEASLRLSVLLDASRSMDTGEPSRLRYGRRLAALLSVVALLHGDGVEVHSLSDGESASGGSFDAGASALGAMIAELERLPSGNATELARSIRRSGRSGWTPELTVLISDGLQPPDALGDALVELARGARSATLIHVSEPPGDAPGALGSTLLIDSETGRQIDAVIDAQTRERYDERHARWRADVERQCHARGVHYLRADASIDPLELLIAAAREEILLRTGSPN